MALRMSLNLALPDVDNPVQTGDTTHRRNCRQLGQLFHKMSMGNVGADGNSLGIVHGYGTVTLSSCSGDLVVTIDGTSVTRAHASSDDADGAALAALINADSTLNKKVLARYAASTNKLTIKSKVAGVDGNYTLKVSGTGLTASGAALTLGADQYSLDLRTSATPAETFYTAAATATGTLTATIGGTAVAITAPTGTDTAAANQSINELATAINADATASKYVRAFVAPHAYVTLTATDAGAVTLTINNIDCTITATGTEDDDGASLVTAINALTASHGCVATYKASSNVLSLTSVRSDKKIRVFASGAGATTVTPGGHATGEVQLTNTTDGEFTVTVNGVDCTVTATATEDDVGALLVTAINAANVAHNCTASYAAGSDLLTIRSDYAGALGNELTLAISGAGAGDSTVSGAVFGTGGTAVAGFDKCVVQCLIPGVIGNAIATTATGTGLTADNARLQGGAESRVTYSL